MSVASKDIQGSLATTNDPAAPVRVQAITVSDNVWLCAQSALLPGTSIGQNSVVGYGAVCAGTYPADVVIAGNPARVVRSIVNDDAMRRESV